MKTKNAILLWVIFLAVVAAGFYLWWQDQQEVRALNNSLPEGVRVEKTLFVEEYKVVNRIDGYEFVVPREWKGLEEIDYIPERTELEYSGSSLTFSGKEGFGRSLAIDQYSLGGDMNADLNSWAISNFETFGLTGEFVKSNVDELVVIKVKEDVHLLGDYVYFFKDEPFIYAVTGGSELFIRDIIGNGKW